MSKIPIDSAVIGANFKAARWGIKIAPSLVLSMTKEQKTKTIQDQMIHKLKASYLEASVTQRARALQASGPLTRNIEDTNTFIFAFVLD